MNVDVDFIKHVAATARINLSEKEAKAFVPQVKDILDAFRKLDEVNTDNVKPSFHPIVLKNRLREDEPQKCLSKEEALKNAESQGDYIRGPKIL